MLHGESAIFILLRDLSYLQLGGFLVRSQHLLGRRVRELRLALRDDTRVVPEMLLARSHFLGCEVTRRSALKNASTHGLIFV